MEPWGTLDQFLAGEIAVDELAERLRETSFAVRALDPDEYVALSGAADRSASSDATAIAARIYERHRPGQLVRDRAERIASGMLAGEINVAAGARALARLR